MGLFTLRLRLNRQALALIVNQLFNKVNLKNNLVRMKS
uniref:Uncharacterized protein n=1 Tax=Siphoviridae sp. ctP0x5 TaxID=2827863 RepID=A0A8S5TF08_9CAUD|nr:MAG TPA: hypothetical protein [Siphoviridae sp. ctP0x5]